MSSLASNDVLTLALELNPEGDGGSYRIKNKPKEVNRPIITDRGDSLTVLADLVAVIHGKVVDNDNPNGGPATLIITDFWLMPNKTSRRFTWAQVTFRISALDHSLGGAGGEGPEVFNIAPKGQYSIEPMKVHLDQGWSADVSASAPIGPVSPGLSFGWELKKGFDKGAQTTLSGIQRLQGREFGLKNTAVWTMKENKTTKQGIPTRLRTAILLKREILQSKAKFQATVDIEVDADIVSQTGFVIKRLLGKIPKDDPVIFDPAISTTSVGFNIQDLAKEDLNKHCRVETSIRLRGDGTLNVDDSKDVQSKDEKPKDEKSKDGEPNEAEDIAK
jgi:hypothetical protein